MERRKKSEKILYISLYNSKFEETDGKIAISMSEKFPFLLETNEPKITTILIFFFFRKFCILKSILTFILLYYFFHTEKSTV